MADFFVQFQKDVIDLVGSVTGLPASQIWTTNQAIKINFVQAILRAVPGPQFDSSAPAVNPLAIVQIGQFRNTTSAGIDNDAYRAPIAIWYLMVETDRSSQNQSNQTVVNQMLYNLGVSVRQNSPAPNAYTSFLQIEDGDIDSSEVEPLNMALRDQGRIDVATGSISWSPGLLVGDFANQV